VIHSFLSSSVYSAVRPALLKGSACWEISFIRDQDLNVISVLPNYSIISSRLLTPSGPVLLDMYRLRLHILHKTIFTQLLATPALLETAEWCLVIWDKWIVNGNTPALERSTNSKGTVEVVRIDAC